MNFAKKILLALFLTAVFPVAALAVTADFQLQISGGGATGGGTTGGGGASPGGATNPPAVNQAHTLSGWTSPNAFVEAFSGNQIVGTAIASRDGSFTLNSIFDSVRSLAIRSTDVFGALAILNAPVNINTAPRNVVGVVLPPSLSLLASSFPTGAAIMGSGRTIPGGMISATLIASNGTNLSQFPAVGADGSFNISFNTTGLPTGPVILQISVNFSGKNETTIINFILGKAPLKPSKCDGAVDLNCDGKVDLRDISILLSYFNKSKFPAAYDLNHDGKINLIDFSIMLHYLNKPVRATLVAATVEDATDGIAPPPMLDVGKNINGDWAAAFAVPDGSNGVVGTDISVDNGASWRPAESPYDLGKTEPKNVTVRAKFVDGTTSQTAFMSRPRWPTFAAVAIGAAFAICLIIIFEFTSRRRGR